MRLRAYGKTRRGRKKRTSGAKAQTIFNDLTARLKSCPFKAKSKPALKRGHIFNDLTARLNSLRKKYLSRRGVTSAAKAGTENKLVVAAVNRCATQNQVQPLLFPQAVKSCPFKAKSKSEFFRSL